ncbi:MAG: hypothetical protein WCO68_05415 [Verrucomicrobiota bacterium]
MNADIYLDLRKLADGWCERRALRALHQFLPGYFSLNGMTDGWGELQIALKDVLVFAKEEITEDEVKEVKRIMNIIHEVIHRR